MRTVHTKNTGASRRRNLRSLCVMFLLLASAAVAQESTQKSKIVCDHAAPPRGMHYVCKSQCDCHLEGKLKNDEDGIAPEPKATLDPETCQPSPIAIFAPFYPEVARKILIGGTVTIQIVIDDNGNVSSASVQQGHPMLAVPALKEVKKWRFTPGCNSVQTVSMRFELDDETRAAFEYHPPNEVVVVGPALIRVGIDTSVAKKRAKKKTSSPK